MEIRTNAAVETRDHFGASSVAMAIDSVIANIDITGPSIELSKKRLSSLADRLREGQLQLAIVGQFKRGKSTLLNAMLGLPILPSAVIPLTAIPTFIREGSGFELRTEGSAGQEYLEATSPTDLNLLLSVRVTEEGNPNNKMGYTRVDVSVDAPLLREGIVFIDTPGVGSTFRHNTEAAKAALPECDVGLFVVSPDPPITEVELEYLKELTGATRNIVIVLNKIDQVDGKDRVRIEEFLRDTVMAEIRTAEFFSVSARAALNAKLEHDAHGLDTSGLLALENYLTGFARTKRHAILQGSIAQKAQAIFNDLIFELDARLAIQRMPIDDLTDRIRQFQAAGAEFERERKITQDILTGDRKRLLSDLDENAADLRSHLEQKLNQEVDVMVAQGSSESQISLELETVIPSLFQPKLEQFESDCRGMLTTVLSAQQRRGDALIDNVRRLASTLLDIPYSAPVAEEAFQIRKTPYWVTAPRESFAGIPHIADQLLPTGARTKRLKRRLGSQISEIVIRNVENLRWSVRQNLENSIRAFQLQLDEQLQLTQAATSVAMEEGLRRRLETQDTSADEVHHIETLKERVAATISQLGSAT